MSIELSKKGQAHWDLVHDILKGTVPFKKVKPVLDQEIAEATPPQQSRRQRRVSMTAPEARAFINTQKAARSAESQGFHTVSEAITQNSD